MRTMWEMIALLPMEAKVIDVLCIVCIESNHKRHYFICIGPKGKAEMCLSVNVIIGGETIDKATWPLQLIQTNQWTPVRSQ